MTEKNETNVDSYINNKENTTTLCGDGVSSSQGGNANSPKAVEKRHIDLYTPPKHTDFICEAQI